MKKIFLPTAILGLVLLSSCKNEVPAAPSRPPVPVEKPKKNDIPNPKPVPEKPATPGGISTS